MPGRRAGSVERSETHRNVSVVSVGCAFAKPTDYALLPAFETAIRKAGFSIVVSSSGKLDQPELLQRGDAVVEPDFLGDLAVFQL